MAFKQADFTTISSVWYYIDTFLKLCINSYIWVRNRHTEEERQWDSKTDNITYQNPNSGGMKGDLNFLLCLLICIFCYEHDSWKNKSNKTVFLIPFMFSEFHWVLSGKNKTKQQTWTNRLNWKKTIPRDLISVIRCCQKEDVEEFSTRCEISLCNLHAVVSEALEICKKIFLTKL